jgi:hypothetical protein
VSGSDSGSYPVTGFCVSGAERSGSIFRVYYSVICSAGRRQFGRPGHGWEVSIKMDLKLIKWSVLNWVNVAQDKDQWPALYEHGSQSPCSIKCWGILE